MKAKWYATQPTINSWINQIEYIYIRERQWKQKYIDSKLMGDGKRSTKMNVYGNKILPQETRKIIDKQPSWVQFSPSVVSDFFWPHGLQHKLTLHLKQLEKEEQRKPKVSGRKEIIKTRGEINKIEIAGFQLQQPGIQPEEMDSVCERNETASQFSMDCLFISNLRFSFIFLQKH